ncbi:hypothetical protein FRB98_000152 [Tulasnella sp. 332]|nr:hypothetical protein FRB98_000152 [Tulasnella sp. 332]
MLATFTPAIPGTLPDDLWVEIYHYLEIVYIVRSARVCRYLNELIKLRPIWVNAISSQIYGQGLELPDRDLDIPLADYDAAVLRDMTIRAIKLTLNLASESPQPTGAKDVQLRGKPNVTHIFLVHGSQSTEWLLFFTDAKSIFCWELLKDPLDLLPASSWDSGEAWILEAVHDTTQSTRCILAVTVKENRTELGAIDIPYLDP